jgi:di/tricarboxylate transporter
MLATALLASIMNNTAVVAIFLPVAAALSRKSGVSPSRLFMPMAFAAVLGGTISLIGTAPNFLVADFYNTSVHVTGGGSPIDIFDFAAVGIPITITGIAYMALVGRRFLPARPPQRETAARPGPEEAAESYQLPERLYDARVTLGSTLVGQTIAGAGIRARHGVDVLAIQRPGPLGERWLQPEPGLLLEADDHLVVEGDEEVVIRFSEDHGLHLAPAAPHTIEHLLERGTTLAEVTIAPHAEAVGRTLTDLGFRERFGVNVIGLWRRNTRIEHDLAHVPLELGDAYLVSGRPRGVAALVAHPDYIVITDVTHREDVSRAPLAVLIMLVALVPPVMFRFPLAVSTLGAAVLMVLTGCLARRSVARSIDWNVLALIVGTLPLGAALEQQGVSTAVAELFAGVAAAGGPPAVYSVLFVLAATFSILTSNAAAAVIVAPVAVAAAQQAGLDPRSALLAMAYGCSCNFLLPFAQCNLLVMSPGGYHTRDYVRTGIGLSIVMGVTTIATLYVLGR